MHFQVTCKILFVEVYSFFQQHGFGKFIEFCRSHKNLSSSGAAHLQWLAKWPFMFVNDAKYYYVCECN
jgi:hypothetical protein